MMQKRDRTKSGIAAFAVALVLLAGASAAQAEMKIPSTPEDYLALAKQYREKAETYRKEAKEHRDMAAAAKKVPSHAEAHGQKNPGYEKMVKHCNGIAAKADALALENEKAADFYELRAKELQGKKP
jgi:hypothetical protein